jgi:hypothetical protein
MKSLEEISDANDVLIWFADQMNDELPVSKESVLAQLLIQRVCAILLIYGNAMIKDNSNHPAALAAMLPKVDLKH